MSDQYVGEIRMFGGTFAISGWAFCDGSLQSISQNPTLYQLLGTTYGGDGASTFGLPDLRGRIPVHQGQGAGLQNYVLGQKGGVETVTLTTLQLPVHSHQATGSSAAGNSASPVGNTWAKNTVQSFGTSTNASMNPASTANTGNSLPHDNMVNFLAVNFIIALFGIYPAQ